MRVRLIIELFGIRFSVFDRVSQLFVAQVNGLFEELFRQRRFLSRGVRLLIRRHPNVGFGVRLSEELLIEGWKDESVSRLKEGSGLDFCGWNE